VSGSTRTISLMRRPALEDIDRVDLDEMAGRRLV